MYVFLWRGSFWFFVSALFRYLGPAFAVLLFEQIDALGVAWFRIASAAVVFAVWTRPWRTFRTANSQTIVLFISLGCCLALMNAAFYLSIERLPLSLVATMEFVGTTAIALIGLKTARNYIALGLAVAGVMLLIDVRWSGDLLGTSLATANALLFMLYITLSHRVSQQGAGEGIARLEERRWLSLLYSSHLSAFKMLLVRLRVLRLSWRVLEWASALRSFPTFATS